MNNKLISTACALGAVSALTLIAFWDRSPASTSTNAKTPAASPAPETPLQRPIDLVHAQRFTVQNPFQHMWRAERPWVGDGWLLVLQCNPEWLTPQQVKQPVLYVGDETADRMNFGDESGHVVVIVPGGDKRLQEAPIFFGSVGLPEEVVYRTIEAELAAARRRGIAPHTEEKVAAVTVPGVLEFEDDYRLRLHAIDLVERYSPQERDLIKGWRAPLVK